MRATIASFEGLKVTIEEKSFRLELIICFFMIPFSIFSDKNWTEKAILILVLLNILIIESINTAIEYTIDRIGLEHNETSKKAKDIGSFSVLLSIIVAVSVWISAFIF